MVYIGWFIKILYGLHKNQDTGRIMSFVYGF